MSNKACQLTIELIAMKLQAIQVKLTRLKTRQTNVRQNIQNSLTQCTKKILTNMCTEYELTYCVVTVLDDKLEF